MKTLLVALQGLRGAPARSILVIATLTLGMLGLVAVLSATSVMRDAVTQKAILLGGDATTVQVSVSGLSPGDGLDAAIAQLQQRSGAASAAATIDDADVGLWTDGERLDLASVTFSTPSLRSIRPFPVIAGEWLSSADLLAPRIVVNEAAAEMLDASLSLGLGTQDARVAAVVGGVVRDGDDQPHAYVDIGQYGGFDLRSPTIDVVLHGPDLREDDARAAANSLVSLGAAFQMNDTMRTDRVDTLASEVATTAQVLFVLGALALGTTILGIMNVGLSSARSRAREFTLRRVMGASRLRIALIVMLESQILAVVSAAIAFGGSYLLFPVVIGSFGSQLGVAPPPYSAWYGLLCLIVACSTAALSSVLPALLSYRRDLSDVMRT